MPLDPTSLLGRTPVVPVLTIEDAAQAVPLARALVSGGLAVLEVTLRTAAALAAIKAIADAVPDAVVGAGTVTNAADIGKAVAAGARFLVSPGTSAALVDAFAAAPVAALPGCATVSEAMALAERGFEVLKFFPAEPSGGLAWLKAVAEPLPRIRFCPTGGVSITNRGGLSGAAQCGRGRRLVGGAAVHDRRGKVRPHCRACARGVRAAALTRQRRQAQCIAIAARGMMAPRCRITSPASRWASAAASPGCLPVSRAAR